jgi:hypothetical protein
MTLVEFLAPITSKGTHLDRVLSVLYFASRYERAEALTAEQIKGKLIKSRVKNARGINVPDVLAKGGACADSAGQEGRAKLWRLTDAGAKAVRASLGLPEADVEIEHDVGALTRLVAKVKDDNVRGYLEEALKCLQVGALKACVVFVWAGTARTIQEALLLKGGPTVTAALQRHDNRARTVTTVDDFAFAKEVHQLQVAQDLGLFDKAEKTTLGEALDLRNRCGHPSKYVPGVKKVSSFIEDIVGIVFKP